MFTFFLVCRTKGKWLFLFLYESYTWWSLENRLAKTCRSNQNIKKKRKLTKSKHISWNRERRSFMKWQLINKRSPSLRFNHFALISSLMLSKQCQNVFAICFYHNQDTFLFCHLLLTFFSFCHSFYHYLSRNSLISLSFAFDSLSFLCITTIFSLSCQIGITFSFPAASFCPSRNKLAFV